MGAEAELAWTCTARMCHLHASCSCAMSRDVWSEGSVCDDLHAAAAPVGAVYCRLCSWTG